MKNKLIKSLLRLLHVPAYDISVQKEIIDAMPEPGDDFDRAYYNYLCNTKGMSPLIRIALECFGFIAVWFFLIFYGIRRMAWGKRDRGEHCDAILIASGNRVGQQYSYEGRVPQELYAKYQNVKELQLAVFPKFTEGVLGRLPFRIWTRFFCRHPFRGFINLRCLVNITAVYRLLLQYTPEAVITARAELNQISSVISFLCEENGTDYINFMHGEVLASMSTAFVRFTRFYIWDEHYKEIFAWGRCPAGQFQVYKPSLYEFDTGIHREPEYYAAYYFCGSESIGKDENAEQVRDILSGFTQKGKKCKVRPHPRWSDPEDLARIFQGTGITMENPREVSVRDSVLSTEKIIGTFSTVLAEAYFMGKDVVIDDVTDPLLLQDLTEKKYILLEKKHELLSELEAENA